MISAKELFLGEFDREMVTTRKMLERVPFDKFDWVPHAKSTPLGRLANHVATLPRFAPHVLDEEKFVMTMTPPLDVKSTADIVAAFDDLSAKARASLMGTTDERLAEEWEFLFGDKTLFKGQRAVAY